ncbi:two-component system, OmpR family, phosphate regulon sensor histidine kinase PhoR [Algoriphagus faecimaris]|uniref:histidine kinase n=1 Tax=Algoriphagus faecimaris TaxID=686796 RepID=A0A1G6XHI5_9BACT|nr:ATP-binding protein [Algoriphagus faecimaris]SDD77694.1 two-component system, OmpR family, phosphate regulon sensor histidine kinase PhoR [Algoriphagus faecimaris]
MLATSRGISLILAMAISALVAAFLSLMDDATTLLILVAAGLAFSAAYLLINITLEFLVFREIGNIYSMLEKIQKKDLSEIPIKSSKSSISPLRKINSVINSYALARQKEIDALQKNAEFRREFIADISHELKTPIFATQGYIHTLLDGAMDDKQVRMKFLKRAAKSLDSLDNLVQDLLTLNQMESGVIKFVFTDFDLKDVIEEVIEELEHKASKRKVHIDFKYDPERSYLTHADRQKIYRVCQNLIFNAVKYNHDEGQVKVTLKASKSNIQVDIKDDGQGIPPEDLKRIFERFYRVEKSRNKKEGGTGLGLAIVKHILEGHKSKISVSSTVGKGSIFSFSLPLVKPVVLESKEVVQKS